MPNPFGDVFGPGSVVALSPDQAAALAALPVLAAKLGAASVTVQSPVTAAGAVINLTRSDDYSSAEHRAIALEFANAPDLTGAAVFLQVGPVRVAGTVTGPAAAAFQPTAAQTRVLPAAGAYNAQSPLPYGTPYAVSALLPNGHTVTLCTGTCRVSTPPGP